MKELKKGQTVYWLGSRVIGPTPGPVKVYEGVVVNKKMSSSIIYFISSDGYEQQFTRNSLYANKSSAQRAANKLNKRK